MTEVILPVNIIIHAAPFFHSLFSLLDFIFSPITKSSLFDSLFLCFSLLFNTLFLSRISCFYHTLQLPLFQSLSLSLFLNQTSSRNEAADFESSLNSHGLFKCVLFSSLVIQLERKFLLSPSNVLP